MRVVLSTWGSRGDVEPLAALAVEAQRLGADVQVCTPPDEEFVALLDRAGVEHVPLGPAVRSVVAGAHRPDAFELAPKLVAARFATLGALAPGCDVLLATGLMPAGARSVCERYDVRYVYAGFHVVGWPSRHWGPPGRPGAPAPADVTDNLALWRHDGTRVDALYLDAENAGRAALGLAPLTEVRDHAFTERPWLAADPVLCPWADLVDLDIVQTGAWRLPDHRPLPADLERFLAAGQPPVYVGFGSIAARLPTELGAVAIAAVRSRGRRLVLGRGWAELAGDDAPDCLAIDEVNQQALFARVAAVVHHGGAGTTTTAARAGAPQVIVPQLIDQPWSARRVAELGIGAGHDGPAPTVDSLSTALEVALTPDVAARASVIAGRLRADGAAMAAARLVDA